MDLKLCIDPEVSDSELTVVAGDCRYGRYCEDASLPTAGARRLVVDRAREFMGAEDAHRLVALSPAGETLGLLLFRVSRWDSDHFGYPVVVIDSVLVNVHGYDREFEVASALLAEAAAWCRRAGVRFASARISARDLPLIHALERSGFSYIESWVFNKYELSRLPDGLTEPPPLRLAGSRDLDFMLEYSKDAFSTQRFHADPRVDPERADSLYRKWILSAFEDTRQSVLALDHDGRAVAFMAYYQSDLSQYIGQRFAMWKMALIDPQCRGRGVGSAFFAALLHHHRREGLDVVDSGLSMRNLASLNLHSKVGFAIVATFVTFHRWFDSCEPQTAARNVCWLP